MWPLSFYSPADQHSSTFDMRTSMNDHCLSLRECDHIPDSVGLEKSAVRECRKFCHRGGPCKTRWQPRTTGRSGSSPATACLKPESNQSLVRPSVDVAVYVHLRHFAVDKSRASAMGRKIKRAVQRLVAEDPPTAAPSYPAFAPGFPVPELHTVFGTIPLPLLRISSL